MRKLGFERLPRRRSVDTSVAVVAATLSAAAGFGSIADAGSLPAYTVVSDAIPASLTGVAGDPVRGRAIVLDRRHGACFLCHSGPFPEERFQGTLAPDLSDAG